MQDLAICSIAFGDQRYIEQLKRLGESISIHEPDATFFSWVNEMPPGAKTMDESLYGFKVHAINFARQKGFTKIVWLDPACILQHSLDYYFYLIPHYGVVAVEDDNLLSNYCSDQAMEWFKETKQLHADLRSKLVGGSLYVFDFDNLLCRHIFEVWSQLESDGLFGSQVQAQSEQINSHRNDESCMTLSVYYNSSEPTPAPLARYNQDQCSIVIKKHFK